MSAKLHGVVGVAQYSPQPVDNTDWLKTIAIVLVIVDHIGYFFIDEAQWWSVCGRWAAPPFFFLLGYAQTRIIPLHWIGLGLVLTLLESWNENWAWVTPNILFSFALIRAARPYADYLLLRFGWYAFVPLLLALLGALPISAQIVDYGSEGWLWALFGICQRNYVDERQGRADPSTDQRLAPSSAGVLQLVAPMRLMACLTAAAVYVWLEQREFSFSQYQLMVFTSGVVLLSVGLCNFFRGESSLQPPEPIAGFVRFIGRRTLEIYAIQLGGSELIVKFFPNLSP